MTGKTITQSNKSDSRSKINVFLSLITCISSYSSTTIENYYLRINNAQDDR